VLLVVTACVALVWTGAAAAKEIVALKVCGLDGCAQADAKLLAALRPDGPGPDPLITGQALTGLAPYYKLTFGVGERRGGEVLASWDAWYVQGRGVVRSTKDARWTKAYPEYRAAIDRLARTLEAFPKPTLTAVTVGGQKVTDPASYAALLEAKPSRRTAYPTTMKYEYIEFASARKSPWTDGVSLLELLPEANVLLRDGEVVRLSPGLASSVEARRSLDAGSGVPWLVLLVAGAAVAITACSVALGLRRRVGAATTPEPTTG
jgi:hypothetical protein